MSKWLSHLFIAAAIAVLIVLLFSFIFNIIVSGLNSL